MSMFRRPTSGRPFVVDLGGILSDLAGWTQRSTPWWKVGADPDEDTPTWFDIELRHEDGRWCSKRGVRFDGYNTFEASLEMVEAIAGADVRARFTDVMVEKITSEWSSACIDRELRA